MHGLCSMNVLSGGRITTFNAVGPSYWMGQPAACCGAANSSTFTPRRPTAQKPSRVNLAILAQTIAILAL